MSTAVDVTVDIVSAGCLLAGGLLAVMAGLGLVRLPDVASRLQAATKPTILGLVLVVIGVAPHLEDPRHAVALVLVVLFQLTTAPVTSQLVGRAAHRSGAQGDSLVVDELAERGER